ncbi:MipA/OmpV family protein [Spongorhabdus nitratireducens]
MTVRSVALTASLLALSSMPALAQADSDESPIILGLGVGLESSLYKDINSEASPMPLVSLEYGDFWIQGEKAGYTLLKGDNWSLSPVISLGLGQGFEKDDVDKKSKLYDGLDDRDSGIGYGLALDYDLQWAELSAAVLNDTESSVSVELDLSREFAITESLSIEPGVNLAWRSSGYNDYYFGIDADEAAKNSLLSTYKAGSGMEMGLEVNATYQLSENWLLAASADYTRFSSDVTDSPLVESKHQTSLMVGIAYVF